MAWSRDSDDRGEQKQRDINTDLNQSWKDGEIAEDWKVETIEDRQMSEKILNTIEEKTRNL